MTTTTALAETAPAVDITLVPPARSAEELWTVYEAAFKAFEAAKEDFDSKRAALAPFGLCDLAYGDRVAEHDDGSPLDPDEAHAVADAVAAHAIRAERLAAVEMARDAWKTADDAESVARFAAKLVAAAADLGPGPGSKSVHYHNTERYPVAELAETLGKLLLLEHIPDDRLGIGLTRRDRNNIFTMRVKPSLIWGRD